MFKKYFNLRNGIAIAISLALTTPAIALEKGSIVTGENFVLGMGDDDRKTETVQTGNTIDPDLVGTWEFETTVVKELTFANDSEIPEYFKEMMKDGIVQAINAGQKGSKGTIEVTTSNTFITTDADGSKITSTLKDNMLKVEGKQGNILTMKYYRLGNKLYFDIDIMEMMKDNMSSKEFKEFTKSAFSVFILILCR